MAPQKLFLEDNYDVADFPLDKKELTNLAKKLIDTKFGTDEPELLADDFEFKFPVVELSKDKFVKAFGSFKVDQAFPDMKNTFYGFRLDPFEPGRIWFDSRQEGLHSGKFGGPFAKVKPTFKMVYTPPQVMSMSFTPEGKLKLLTGGYVVDKNIGNTGGLGGIFGIMYAIGHPLPFPEARPHVMSWRYWLLQRVQQAVDLAQHIWKEYMGKSIAESPAAVEESETPASAKKAT